VVVEKPREKPHILAAVAKRSNAPTSAVGAANRQMELVRRTAGRTEPLAEELREIHDGAQPAA
jgi:hypothetical protein